MSELCLYKFERKAGNFLPCIVSTFVCLAPFVFLTWLLQDDSISFKCRDQLFRTTALCAVLHIQRGHNIFFSRYQGERAKLV